jgi:hypothetical protein
MIRELFASSLMLTLRARQGLFKFAPGKFIRSSHKNRERRRDFYFCCLKIKACVPGRRFLAYFFGAVAKEVSRQKGEKTQPNMSRR